MQLCLIVGQLQNPSSKDSVRHLLAASKTESEQDAVGAWRKGKKKQHDKKMKKQQSMRKRGDNWQTNRQKIVECEQTVHTSTNKYMYWISFMYAKTLVKSSFMFCLRQSSQSITFCLFTDAGKCRAGSEVRRFRFSKFKAKIWIWFSLCTSWLPYSTLQVPEGKDITTKDPDLYNHQGCAHH